MASFRFRTPAGVFKHLYGRRYFNLGPFVSVGAVVLFLAIIIPRAASGSCFTNLATQYEISPEEKAKLERKHTELDKCMRAAVRRISETDKNWTFQTRTAGSSSPDKHNESTKSNPATLIHVVGTVPGAVATGTLPLKRLLCRAPGRYRSRYCANVGGLTAPIPFRFTMF